MLAGDVFGRFAGEVAQGRIGAHVEQRKRGLAIACRGQVQRVFAIVVYGVRVQTACQQQRQRAGMYFLRGPPFACKRPAHPQMVGGPEMLRQALADRAPFRRGELRRCQRIDGLRVREGFEQRSGLDRIARHAHADPSIHGADLVVLGAVFPQHSANRLPIQACRDRQGSAPIAVREVHFRAVLQQRFDDLRIVVQHHGLVQAIALEAPNPHRPVWIAAVLQQQAGEVQIVVAQRMGQGVADVPLRRLCSQEHSQTGHVALAHGVPHGAAFVQRRAVGDIRAGLDEQLRQGGIAGAADGGAERGAVAADGLRFPHSGVDVRSQGDELPSDVHSRQSRLAAARRADVHQRRPVPGRQAFVDVLGGESTVGQQTGDLIRFGVQSFHRVLPQAGRSPFAARAETRVRRMNSAIAATTSPSTMPHQKPRTPRPSKPNPS